MHCMSFYFHAISVSALWVTAVKSFTQLPCIFAHLRISLCTYARRAAIKFVWASIDVTYVGDSTAQRSQISRMSNTCGLCNNIYYVSFLIHILGCNYADPLFRISLCTQVWAWVQVVSLVAYASCRLPEMVEVTHGELYNTYSCCKGTCKSSI